MLVVAFTLCSCAEARISSCGGGGGGGGGTVVAFNEFGKRGNHGSKISFLHAFTPTVLVTICSCAEARISSCGGGGGGGGGTVVAFTPTVVAFTSTES